MARELVLSTWTMLLALELKMLSSAVLMTVILQTVSTLRMLASYASSVQMVTSDWLVVLHLTRDVWRFAKMQSGELYVMIAGITLMLLLLAGNLDSLEQMLRLFLMLHLVRVVAPLYWTMWLALGLKGAW